MAELSVQLRAHLDGKGGSELTPDMAEKLRKLLRSQETAPAALGLLRALRYDGSAQPITPRCTAGKRCPSAGWSSLRDAPSSIS